MRSPFDFTPYIPNARPAAGGQQTHESLVVESSESPAAGLFSSFPLWRLARELRARPVAIDPRAFAELDAQLSAAIAARVADAPRHVPRLVARDDGGPRVRDKKPAYAVRDDGVAVVPLRGVCGRHLSEFAMECGGCDVDRVREAVAAADDDPAVRAIVLDVDSPGGSVCGVYEAAAVVRGTRKAVVAYAPDQCASAAYWIASQADFIVVGPTADVGSVGVYCALLDKSRAYDARGLRVDMIASGANKGAGYPGTTLTDEQRAVLQSQVDYVASLFKAAVLRGRAGDEPDESILDGRCLVGAQAVAANLADAVGDLSLAASYALRLAGENEWKP